MNISGKPLTPESRRNLAEVYVQYLALEPPATKAGIESTERFEAIMRWWHLRSLADLYRVELQEQFKNPSPDELHSYYMQHLTNYQRIKASRILIPHTPGSTEEAKRADEKALQAANLAQQRVANGEDPEVVQKDAYSALGTSSPPPTILGTLARSSFPATETDELFSLETGSVSKVETEGVSYVIYKIESKETLSEDSVKDEISRQIAQDKFRDAMRVINEAAKPEFNPSYFALPKSAPLVVEPNPRASPHP
jgi:parvulin-like peptidyl-prolyl isomerase